MFLYKQLETAVLTQTSYEEFTSDIFDKRIHSFLLHPIMYYRNEDRSRVNFINVQLKIYNHGGAILIFTLNESEELTINDFTQLANDFEIQSAYFPTFFFDLEKSSNLKNSNNSTEEFKYKKLGRCKYISEAITRYSSIIQTTLKDKKTSTYSINYQSLYIPQITNNPYSFGDQISGEFKSNIIQMMDCIPQNFYTEDIINKKYSMYKYGKYKDLEIYSNQFRTITVLSDKIIKETIDDVNATLLNQIEISQNKKDEIFTEPASVHLDLIMETRANIYFILEFMLLNNLSLTDYNQGFNEVFISESQLLKLELRRFYDWRNENILINSRYGTTLEMFNWIITKTEDKEKLRLINYNREFSKQISAQKRANTREKMNIILAILSFIVSMAFSYEPISMLYEAFEITDTHTIFRSYILFNLCLLVVLFIIFSKEINNKFQDTKLFSQMIHKYHFILIESKNFIFNFKRSKSGSLNSKKD